MAKNIDHEAIFVYAVNQAYWFGEVRRKEIERAFSISHETASEIVGRLRAEGFLQPKGKAFEMAPGAADLPFVTTRLSVQACLQGMPEASADEIEPCAWRVDSGLNIARANVLREILQAHRAYQSIEIVHVSMQANAKALRRTIEPLEFIQKDGGWHVLAHCHLANDRVCFELAHISRVGRRQRARWREVPKMVRGKYLFNPTPSDTEKAVFEPHPMLTDDQKSAVAFQFGMLHQRLKLSLPARRMSQFRQRYAALNALSRPEGKLLIEIDPQNSMAHLAMGARAPFELPGRTKAA